ncbi:MAG: HypC/HybG/HupF family hydrogenase formation chaperone [Anaerolineaceae bacterium]|nr:HypC/HybG/HupF family hydrogenase formation chaperone [Anaerolineaceae bacterium]
MCLGIPGKIINIYENSGTRMCELDFGGVTQEACLEALPEAKVGNYAIVHAGFVLSLLSEEDANETLDILREMSRLADEEENKLAAGN